MKCRPRVLPVALATAFALMSAGGVAAAATNLNSTGPAPTDFAKESLGAAILSSTQAITNGLTPPVPQGDAYALFSSPMQYAFGAPPPDPKWTNWVYKRNPGFWLNGVKGVDAINAFPYQMQLTLVTPRHCLTVEHTQGCGSNVMVCFVDTNNVAYWRRSLGTVAIGKDLRACILDAPVPIAPMPVIALRDLTDKIDVPRLWDLSSSASRGFPIILFNQFWRAWAGDIFAASGSVIHHKERSTWIKGWSSPSTNSSAVGGGDSGSARCVIINHQFYLIGVAAFTTGESPISDVEAINAALDRLSTETAQPKDHVTRFDVKKYPVF